MKAAGVLACLITLSTGAGAEEGGAGLFAVCRPCHSVAAGEHDLPGPNLRGVVGRRAGAAPGFGYSPALEDAAAAGLVWTRAALDRYLTDPRAAMPGTLMVFEGFPDAADRAALVAWLARQAD